MRRGIRQPVLLDLGVRQAQFGGGRFRIQIQSRAVLLFGFGGVARFEQRLGPIQARPKFLGLPVHGLFQIFHRVTGLLVANQKNAGVQFGLIQAGFQLQHFLVFREAIGIALQHGIGKRQVEVRRIILGIGGDGFAEQFGGLVVFRRLQGLRALRVVVRSL